MSGSGWLYFFGGEAEYDLEALFKAADRSEPTATIGQLRGASNMKSQLTVVGLGGSLAKHSNSLLLGCFGAGAIGGALIMQTLRARFSTEIIVSAVLRPSAL